MVPNRCLRKSKPCFNAFPTFPNSLPASQTAWGAACALRVYLAGGIRREKQSVSPRRIQPFCSFQVRPDGRWPKSRQASRDDLPLGAAVDHRSQALFGWSFRGLRCRGRYVGLDHGIVRLRVNKNKSPGVDEPETGAQRQVSRKNLTASRQLY